MYWSFTDSLVKTNMDNTMIAQVPVLGGHMGDISYHKGKLYASVMGNSMKGKPWGVWTSFFVYVFDAESLSLLKTLRLDPCYDMYKHPAQSGGFNGVDGITVVDGEDGKPTIWVACALFSEERYKKQILLNFDLNGELLETRKFTTGNTIFGIQNLDYDKDTGYFWFSTYSQKYSYQSDDTLFCVNAESEQIISAHKFHSPYGLQCLGNGKLLVSIQSGVNGNRSGYAYETDISSLQNGPKTEEEAIKKYLK